MSKISILFRREFSSFFATPVAYVFIGIFLILSSVFTFFVGGLYERGQADLLLFLIFILGYTPSW
jgi:ABC-2 type transport system permease protein